MCVYECLEKHVVMYTLKTCCMSVREWVNVACSVRSALSGQLDLKGAIQVQSIYHLWVQNLSIVIKSKPYDPHFKHGFQ